MDRPAYLLLYDGGDGPLDGGGPGERLGVLGAQQQHVARGARRQQRARRRARRAARPRVPAHRTTLRPIVTVNTFEHHY